MLVLAYLGSQCTKFHTAGWTCWFFTFCYLESCIWHDSISRWIRQRNGIKFCTNLGRSTKETLAMIRQAFGEESMSRTQEAQTHRDRKKGKTGEEQCQKYALWHQGDWLFTKICSGRPNCQFGVVLWRFTATAWECAKTSSRTLATNKLAVASELHFHLHFHQDFFYQNSMMSPAHPTFPCFPIEVKNWKTTILTQLRWSRQNHKRCWTPT
jgi:hypothetical protein